MDIDKVKDKVKDEVKDRGLSIDINGKQIPARISIGELFGCSSAINYFSIFIISPLVLSLLWRIAPSPIENEPKILYIVRILQNVSIIICSLAWIYGLNDLCKLRKKGGVEINFAFVALNIICLFGLIQQLFFWQTSWSSFGTITFWMLIVFLCNILYYKIVKGFKAYKSFFTAPQSDWIPFPALTAIILIIYLSEVFKFEINPIYYLHQLTSLIYS